MAFCLFMEDEKKSDKKHHSEMKRLARFSFQ